MKPQLKLGLACIVVALVLMIAACTPAKAEDMEPGAICTTERVLKQKLQEAYRTGESIGMQLGGQAAVNELLGHFKGMCAAYQSLPDKEGVSAPEVELRNGIRIQCAK